MTLPPPEEPAAGPPEQPQPEPIPAGVAPAGIAWERWRDLGVPKALLETVRESLLKPVEFFQKVDPAGRILPPLAYAVLVSWIAVAFAVLWNVVLPDPFAGLLDSVEERRANFAAGLLALFALWLLVPFWIPLLLLLMAAVYHVILLVLGGPSRGFTGTIRVLGYSSAPQLWVIVPFCGSLIVFVWGFVLQVIGLREVHGIPTGKAIAVLIIPLLLCVILILAVGALVLVTLVGAAKFGSR